MKFRAVAEKTAKGAMGLLYFAAPGILITATAAAAVAATAVGQNGAKYTGV